MTEATNERTGKLALPEFIPNQKYTTPEGHEYFISNIARESGNIDDLFVVYNQCDQTEIQNRQSWVKKYTPNMTPDAFDQINHPKIEGSDLENIDRSIIGQRYKHFKTQDEYIVKDVAIDPVDPNVKYIIYEGQYDSPEFGNHPIWIREFSDFTGMKVFDDGRPVVKRFTLID